MLPLPVGRLEEETECSKPDFFFPATPSSDEESQTSTVVRPGLHFYNPTMGPVFAGYVPYVQMVPCRAAAATWRGLYVLRMDVHTLLHARRVRECFSDQSIILPDGEFGFKVMIQPVQLSHGRARFKTCSSWNLLLKSTETPGKLEGPSQHLAVYINGARVGSWSPGEFTCACEVLAEDVRQNEKLTLRLGRQEETECSKSDFFPATPVYPGMHYCYPSAGPVFVGHMPCVQMVPCIAPEPAAEVFQPEFNVTATRRGNCVLSYVLRMDIRMLLFTRRVQDCSSDQSMILPDGQFGFKVTIQPTQGSQDRDRFKTCSSWDLLLESTTEKPEGPSQRLAVYINGARVGTWSPGDYNFAGEVLVEDVQQNEKLTLRLAGI